MADAFSNSILKFDLSGNILTTISSISEPLSLAVNSNGDLFVGDGATGHIYKCEDSGDTILFYAGLNYPTSMVFSPDNTLYVADSKQQQVIVLDISGNLIRTIGNGTLEFPTGLAYDANNKRVLVGEHGGSGTGFKPIVKVYMYDSDGSLYRSFGSHGGGDGQFYRIQGITVGKCGHIFVLDPYQARVSVFDENGEYITKFGTFGLQEGELNIPMDIIYNSMGQLVVSSLNNGSLEFYAISDSLPTATIRTEHFMICEGESSDIEIGFTGTAPWTFTYTVDGADPGTVTTSDNPFLLTVSEHGHYEVVDLSDAVNTGTCFTGSADVNVTNELTGSLIQGDALICEGESADISIEFSGSAPWTFTYVRDGMDPVTVQTTNNPHILSVSESGIYEIISLWGGGCTGTGLFGSASIGVHPLPSAILTDGNKQIYVDPGELADLPVELTGTPPWSFVYTVDDLNPESRSNISEDSYVLTDSKIGTYEIKKVSDALCSSTVSFGYPELVMSSSVTLPTSLLDGGDFYICPGESVPIQIQFTGTAPWTFTYVVDTLITTTIFNTYTNPYIINAIYPGTYEVIALSDSKYSGTEFVGSANVNLYSLPAPLFTYNSANLEVSFNNASVYADSYFWDFGDGINSMERNPVHQYQKEGDYIVSLTASNDLCGALTLTDTLHVTTLSIQTTGLDEMLRVYPNPSNGKVFIEYGNGKHSSMFIELLDMNGRMLYSNSYQSKVREELDLSIHPSGLYIIRIVSNDAIDCRKLILNNH